MTTHTVASTDEIAEGERMLVELEGREIGIFNVDGTYHAYLNWCVHQSGPCCEGSLTGTTEAEYDADAGEVDLSWVKEDKILNCPWHGWEYEIETGDCLSKREHTLPSYPVTVEDGEITVEL